MGVLAHEVRFGVTAFRVGDHVVDFRVHSAVHVGRVVVALVVNGARRIQLSSQVSHGEKRVACAGLIAEGPHHDGWVIFVALDHSLQAIETRRFPGRVAAGNEAVHTLRLQVRFIDHVDAVAIAQFVPVRMVRVMGSTHGVDVEALHQQDVLQHGLAWNRAAEAGVVFVAVHTFEQDGHTVHQETAVADFDLPKAEMGSGRFQDLTVAVLERQCEPVEVGRFRRPFGWISNSCGKCDRGFRPSGNAGECGGEKRNRTRGAVRGHSRQKFDGFRRPGTVVVHADADAQVGVPVLRVQVSLDGEVANVERRRAEQVDVPVNAAEAPHVLVFQVAAVGPAVDLHGEHVFPLRFHVAGDVEFRRGHAALAVANALTVHPDVERGLHAVEVQENLAAGPVLWQLESPPVRADRVTVFVHARGLRQGKAEPGVDVDRYAVAVHLPVAGHGQVVPRADVERRLVEIHGPFGGIG